MHSSHLQVNIPGPQPIDGIHTMTMPSFNPYEERPVSPPPQKERFCYTRYQLELLTAIINKVRYPNTMQKQLIAKRVGITRDQVKIWFQNRRRKDVIASQQPNSDAGKTNPSACDYSIPKMAPLEVVDSVLAEIQAYNGDQFKTNKKAREAARAMRVAGGKPYDKNHRKSQSGKSHSTTGKPVLANMSPPNDTSGHFPDLAAVPNSQPFTPPTSSAQFNFERPVYNGGFTNGAQNGLFGYNNHYNPYLYHSTPVTESTTCVSQSNKPALRGSCFVDRDQMMFNGFPYNQSWNNQYMQNQTHSPDSSRSGSGESDLEEMSRDSSMCYPFAQSVKQTDISKEANVKASMPYPRYMPGTTTSNDELYKNFDFKFLPSEQMSFSTFDPLYNNTTTLSSANKVSVY